MGGYGSGRRWGASKALTSDHNRLDILWMKRHGCLSVGKSGSINWSSNGEPAGSIQYTSQQHSIRLGYKSRQYGGEWQSVDYSIAIDWEECRFGGSRPYFICQGLGCGKRVQHLYAGSPYFVCRHCLGLAYKCQREGLLDRAARRADKIRNKLEAEPGILNGAPIRKPKGMHWKTYYRLCEEENYFSQISLAAMCQKFGFDPKDGFG